MSEKTTPNRGRVVYVRAKKTLPYQGGLWSEKKKHEAVCLYVSGLPMTQIAVEINVPYYTIREWRASKWWEDIVKDIRSEDAQKLDAKLTKILDKSLETVMDRLENGDYIYDQKTGKIRQTPVKLRDTVHAMNTVMDKRQLIRKEPTKIVEQQSSADQLKELAKQFEAFVTGQNKAPDLKDVVSEFIEGETIEQLEDGTFTVKD